MHSLAFGILMGQKLEALGETHLLSKSQRTVWLTLVLGHCKKRDCDMQLPAVPPVKGLLDPAKRASCSNSSYTALWTMACLSHVNVAPFTEVTFVILGTKSGQIT